MPLVPSWWDAWSTADVDPVVVDIWSWSVSHCASILADTLPFSAAIICECIASMPAPFIMAEPVVPPIMPETFAGVVMPDVPPIMLELTGLPPIIVGLEPAPLLPAVAIPIPAATTAAATMVPIAHRYLIIFIASCTNLRTSV